jgi:hypothetical protein
MRFAHYRGRFAPPHDDNILDAMYQCAYTYYEPNDSLDFATDSLGGTLDIDVEETVDTLFQSHESE